MIRYRRLIGWKYRLGVDYTIQLRPPPERIEIPAFVVYETDGTLTVKCGYAWDGPSGPTVDTRNFMRGSLVHDVLYQLLREGRLWPREEWRAHADDRLRALCLEDGMSRLRAWYVHRAVRWFAARHALPRPGRSVLLSAP